MDEYKEYEKKHPEVAEIRRKLSEEIRRIIESSLGIPTYDSEYDGCVASKVVRCFCDKCKESPTQSTEPDSHGRWENLSLSDLQFLYEIGVDID